jgi:hypothetical protein
VKEMRKLRLEMDQSGSHPTKNRDSVHELGLQGIVYVSQLKTTPIVQSDFWSNDFARQSASRTRRIVRRISLALYGLATHPVARASIECFGDPSAV